jgi:hypothetical protein
MSKNEPFAIIFNIIIHGLRVALFILVNKISACLKSNAMIYFYKLYIIGGLNI